MGILTRTQIRKSINLLIPTDTRIRTILRDHQSIRIERNRRVADELVALDENLVVGSGVDGLVEVVFVEIVVDMLMSEMSVLRAVVQEQCGMAHPNRPAGPLVPQFLQ